MSQQQSFTEYGSSYYLRAPWHHSRLDCDSSLQLIKRGSSRSHCPVFSNLFLRCLSYVCSKSSGDNHINIFLRSSSPTSQVNICYQHTELIAIELTFLPLLDLFHVDGILVFGIFGMDHSEAENGTSIIEEIGLCRLELFFKRHPCKSKKELNWL